MTFSSSAFNALCVLALTIAVEAQSATTTGTPTAQEPCAQVSVFSSQYMSASPSATYVPLPPDVAYACQQSVPLVKEDTLAVLTGLKAWVQWQSNLAWVKNPPASWPFAPVDLVGGLQDLTEKVEDGTITREIDFETRLVDLMSAVHDGHLTFIPDAYSVFNYYNPKLPIVSVSSDGKQLPEIYAVADLVAQQEGAGGWTPSPIVKINGTDTIPYLSQLAFNGTMAHQDLDALYNRLFFSPLATDDSDAGYFSTPLMSRFWGSSIMVEFKNGSQASFPMEAVLQYDFTDVVDGESFYQTFCNATVKAMASASASSAPTAQPTATTAPDPAAELSLYPTAVAISDDGELAGYFLDDEPSVAILSIHAMSEDGISSQQALKQFLQQCRQANKTHLIVDLSQNGGGLIELAYDIFKQLFPTIQPYLGAQLRAQEQVNILGEFYTPIVQQARNQGDINSTDPTIVAGIYSTFDSTSLSNDSGLPFPSWADYYGPVQVHGDNFAHQYQLNLSDIGYDEAVGGMVPFGYGNNSKVAPQPFLSENMVIFGDGYCASACTILSHLLKYQGKVKSIVIGGRPQTGPMQSIGGTKGCQVQPLPAVLPALNTFYQNASAEAITAANQTTLKDLADQANTLLLRQDAKNGDVQVNLLNAIAQYDESQTPLQFVYEAADCRLWFQTAHTIDVTAIWQTVAEQAWGLNGQEKYSLCVPGSTNQPSSLSGNQTLFQDGQPSNVTGYNPGEGAAQSTSEQNASGSLTFGAGCLSSMVFGILLAAAASSANLMI